MKKIGFKNPRILPRKIRKKTCLPDIHVGGVEEEGAVTGVRLLPVDVVEVNVVHARVLGASAVLAVTDKTSELERSSTLLKRITGKSFFFNI